ncbi:MAG: hypothetical protein JWN95_1888 [Frankiales bacterium]|nr:hypothetical protein [Frankiales bacterium]
MNPATGPVLAIDTPLTTLAEAEHSLFGLGQAVVLPADALVCTHEVRDAAPHYAFSITFSGPVSETLRARLIEYLGDWPMMFDAGPVGSDVPVGSQLAVGVGSDLGVGVSQALDEVRRRAGGRAVRFPGREALTGSLPIAAVLADSAIDRMTLLGGGTIAPDWQLTTRDFVRPRWQQGDLVLAVMPAGSGTVAPFEVPNPTPCCGGH